MEGCIEWVGATKEGSGSGKLEHTVEPSQCRGPNSTEHQLRDCDWPEMFMLPVKGCVKLMQQKQKKIPLFLHSEIDC